jgi:hypothetical protein
VAARQDGGLAVAGSTYSRGAGGSDAWVLRLAADGRPLWDETFGGPGEDEASAVAAMPDGGLAVAGSTYSKGAGELDAWVLRLAADGRLLWDRTLGGEGRDRAQDAAALPDGDLAVAGSTASKGAGDLDGWVLRLREGDTGAEVATAPAAR